MKLDTRKKTLGFAVSNFLEAALSIAEVTSLPEIERS
jgi:hypothetical protein